jgi:hypothetical protein
MILNAIQAGMDKKETNNAIKLAATVALRNSLEFTRDNFTRPVRTPFSLYRSRMTTARSRHL